MLEKLLAAAAGQKIILGERNKYKAAWRNFFIFFFILANLISPIVENVGFFLLFLIFIIRNSNREVSEQSPRV